MSERKIMSLALKIVSFVTLLRALDYLGVFAWWIAEFYRPESEPPSFIDAVPVLSNIILHLFFGFVLLVYSDKLSGKICSTDEKIIINEQQSFGKLLEVAFIIIGIAIIATKTPTYLYYGFQNVISLKSWSATYHFALPDFFRTTVYAAVGFCLIKWSRQLTRLVCRLKKIPSSGSLSNNEQPQEVSK